MGQKERNNNIFNSFNRKKIIFVIPSLKKFQYKIAFNENSQNSVLYMCLYMMLLFNVFEYASDYANIMSAYTFSTCIARETSFYICMRKKAIQI